ncbi:MAG: F0F1 ATP synthase subunit delta [Inhella sp.]|jgi:F-type H+-transporting ATPase subunit delta|uniref:F0F1 ATP synthase subunit delta n=1 Tax=Inhella sp. TaxID=1921806 RepID=UPI0022C6B285|nr:F0F1 ATP synthase subunit delta [Inhella sp.]MCZ8236404.1 F0F1 ATP synthase subunit delta [Inhella sp.]
MAELATIARPYAEALFQVARQHDLNAWREQIDALALVAGDAGLRQFADHPKTLPVQVFDVMVEAAKLPLAEGMRNFLRTVIDNGRLDALPAVAAQFHRLASEAQGVAEAQVESAFALDAAQLADLLAVLEKRFGRKLTANVTVEPSLIGGVRVTVGDEVLDTSVRARLERMKTTLTA